MKSNSKSIHFVLIFCSLTVLSWVILTEAHPLDNEEDKNSLTDSFGFSSNEFPQDEIKQAENVPLTRNKRTIGFLRQLFPGVSQIIDRKIQQITRILFRVVGRLILRGGANSGANGGSTDSGGDGGRKISITLPTYPPIEDEEEEDTNPPATDRVPSSSSEVTPELDSRTEGSQQVPVQANSTTTSSSTSTAANTEIPDSNATSTPIVTTTDALDNTNTIVRKSRDVSDVLSDTTLPPDTDSNSSSSTTTESATTKRAGFLWRLGRNMRSTRGNAPANGGNFLYDLVRLIAGSGVTPEKDEELNAPREERDDSSASADSNDVTDSSSSSNYNPEEDTSGIPGPLTRLALLVNRGVANVFKDLIVRMAQTSERIVNYKARLITAII